MRFTLDIMDLGIVSLGSYKWVSSSRSCDLERQEHLHSRGKVEEKKPVTKTENDVRGEKTENHKKSMSWKPREKNTLRRGGLRCHITEKQSKLRTEKYLLDWATRKAPMTLMTAFSWSDRSRSHAPEVWEDPEGWRSRDPGKSSSLSMEGRGERGRRKGEKGQKGVGKGEKRRGEEGKEKNGREGKWQGCKVEGKFFCVSFAEWIYLRMFESWKWSRGGR